MRSVVDSMPLLEFMTIAVRFEGFARGTWPYFSQRPAAITWPSTSAVLTITSRR
jgi:hypothetical protein